MGRFVGILGLALMMALAWLFSTNRRAMIAGTMANLMSASIVGILLR